MEGRQRHEGEVWHTINMKVEGEFQEMHRYVYVNDLGDDVCEWSVYIKMPDSGYGYQIQLDDEVIRDICELWQSYQDSGATGSSKTGLFASGNSSSRP